MKKYRVKWTPLAREHLKAIEGYIAQHNPQAAKAFVKRIRERGRKLTTLPYAGSPVADISDEQLREFYVGNYRIIYEVFKAEVVIHAVIHGARAAPGPFRE